jgi:hypothetical protein
VDEVNLIQGFGERDAALSGGAVRRHFLSLDFWCLPGGPGFFFCVSRAVVFVSQPDWYLETQ